MRRLLLLATTALVGYACWRSDRNVPHLAQPGHPPVGEDAANVAEVTRNFLMGFVLPLWLASWKWCP